MNGLTLKITTGNKKALALAKTFITTPTLINYDPTQGAMYAIPLSVETNQRSAAAEVSESLIIASDVKNYVSDNIAPGTKSWRLSGYIKGFPTLEPTNIFKPFVRLHTGILWNWFDSGAVLVFKDGDSSVYTKVVIKDLQTAQQKDCASATPFTMTLKEIKVMKTSVLDLPDLVNRDRIVKSIATIGSIQGAALGLGMTMTEVAMDVQSEESA